MNPGPPPPRGVLVVNKSTGITSHDVIDQVRRSLNAKQYRLKIGHAGTLDPFATGVLVIGVGQATRLLQFAQDLPKTYQAAFELGATSDTFDVTGTITPCHDVPTPTSDQLKRAIDNLVGEQEQVPPATSARKYRGKKLYEYARAGADDAFLEKAAGERARQITVHRFEVDAYHYPTVDVEIACSSGTYIRALARDLGHALGTGAFVKHLCRTAVGSFDISSSLSPKEFSTPLRSENPGNTAPAPSSEKGRSPTLLDFLRPSNELVAHLPALSLSEEDAHKFQHGQKLAITDVQHQTAPYRVMSQEVLIGIGDAQEGPLEPRIVLK